MDEIERDAQQIAYNTPGERHHSTCKRVYSPAGQLVSERTNKCDCWVFHSAKAFLLKQYGTTV